MSRKTSDYKFEAVLGSGSFGAYFKWNHFKYYPSLEKRSFLCLGGLEMGVAGLDILSSVFYSSRVHLVRKLKDRKLFVVKEQDVSRKAKATYEMVVGEVQCLKKMRHPNIVAYHAAWNEGSWVYILMEYASRGTLKDLLERRRKPLKKEDALYLFSQVVLGVHHIHSQKILHRDLKPENIMLTGKLGDIVKIGDFGVSKSMREISAGSGLAGSYYFMAPEMLQGKHCDYKADVWSMGAILYWMITYELPFPAKNLRDLIDSVSKSKVRPLEDPVSVEEVSLISKMLRINASYRPRTDQLLLCPHLVPFVIRVHLNLGRVTVSKNQQHVKVLDAFKSYFKKFPNT